MPGSRGLAERARFAVVGAAAASALLLTGAPAQAAWPGRNGEIAFSATELRPSDVSHNSDIVTVSPEDGRVLKRLTTDPRSDGSPSWSPDGRKVAYDREGTEIVVINADGSHPRVVVQARPVGQPSWSPDGKRIVFETRRSNDQGLHLAVINADGSGGQTALTSGHNDFAPKWSPDGSRIAFVRSEPGSAGGKVQLLDVVTRVVTPLVNPDSGFSESWPDWSPDGRQIVFPANRGVYVVKADGSGLHRLGNDAFVDRAIFSPDGQKVLIVTFVEDGPGGLTGELPAILPSTGGPSTLLLTNGDVYWDTPSWRPLPSPPRTRYVDDDRAQCPQARFSTIQAAVDASDAGDVVRVCSGTYPEQITVPPIKPGLQLRSVPLGGANAARIVAPPGGLASVPVPEEGTSTALITLAAERMKLLGFHISGPLTLQECPGVAHGVDIRADGVYVDRNHLDHMVDGCRDLTKGLVVADAHDVLLDRNVVEDALNALNFVRSEGAAQRNEVTGRAGYPWGVGLNVYQSTVTARVNHITHFGRGMDVSRSRFRAIGNDVRGNRVGVEVSLGSHAELSRNVISHNVTDGIVVDPVPREADAISLLIRGNEVLDNGGDGILIHFSQQPRESWIHDNVALRNGGVDCRDENFTSSLPFVDPSLYHWSRNIGDTAIPRGICRAR